MRLRVYVYKILRVGKLEYNLVVESHETLYRTVVVYNIDIIIEQVFAGCRRRRCRLSLGSKTKHAQKTEYEGLLRRPALSAIDMRPNHSPCHTCAQGINGRL